MLPNSLSSLTYQDVFRLLRQRQLGNSSQSSNSNSNDKNKSGSPTSNSRPSEQTTGTTTSNANLVQQLQALMLLGLLNRSANAENEPPKSNILSSSQNKLNTKSASDSNLITKESRGSQSLTKSGAKLPKINLDDLTMTPNLDESEGSQANPSDSQLFDPKSKKIRKTNTCGHPERAHYAKNMCNQCYHKHGRTKKPWKCNHEKLYAHGLCQNCYINAYNKKRSQKVKDEKAETPKSENTESKFGSLPSPSLKDSLIMEDKTAFEEEEDNPNATHQNSPKIESEDDNENENENDKKTAEKEAPREENPQEDQNNKESTAMEVEEKHNQGE